MSSSPTGISRDECAAAQDRLVKERVALAAPNLPRIRELEAALARPCECDAPRCEREGCQDKPTPSAASGLRVKLTTHKVVIDANDEAHAADLYERWHNDGVRVHRETHKLVQDDLGYMSTEVERVG